MGCDWTNPATCFGDVVGVVFGGTVPAAWEMVSKSFVDAASQLLLWFGKTFAALPPADVTSP